MKKRQKKRKFKTEIRNESIRRFLFFEFFFAKSWKRTTFHKVKKNFFVFSAKCGENITLKLDLFSKKKYIEKVLILISIKNPFKKIMDFIFHKRAFYSLK